MTAFFLPSQLIRRVDFDIMQTHSEINLHVYCKYNKYKKKTIFDWNAYPKLTGQKFTIEPLLSNQFKPSTKAMIYTIITEDIT